MIQIVDLYTIKKGFKLGLKLAHSKQAMGCMAAHYNLYIPGPLVHLCFLFTSQGFNPIDLCL